MTSRPIFVKLGGSLITYKARPRTVRRKVLQRLAAELATFYAQHPGQDLLIGHGSGSFGHWAARAHGWRGAVPDRADPRALAAIAQAAAALHHQVMEALRAAGLPAWSFPPSAAAVAREGRLSAWDVTPLAQARAQGWVPVVYGDVVLDTARGGAIVSTEDVFAFLAPRWQPARVLLVGLEPGVWRDWPRRRALWTHITPAQWEAAAHAAQGAAGPDVTGGMAGKVARMVALVQQVPGLEVRILSGRTPQALTRALKGEPVGTLITADAYGSAAA